MAEEPTDQQLRKMADHRGLKLVKSRKRKAGAADFGMFGLTDESGKALLGIGEDGLTATAQDVQAYLRTDAMGTWKQSADAIPDPAPSRPRPADKGEATDEQPVRRRQASPSRETPRRSSAPRKQESGKPRKLADQPERKPRSEPRPSPANPPPPEPKTEPELRIRPARPDDARQLAHLLHQLGGVTLSRDDVVRHLAQARKLKAGMLVAERGNLIGCCGWAVVPTIQRGAVGRLTALVVGADHRHSGIGTALLDAASRILAKAGCTQMEAMSDIEIANAHNFFRALDFNQASYRFVRLIGASLTGSQSGETNE